MDHFNSFIHQLSKKHYPYLESIFFNTFFAFFNDVHFPVVMIFVFRCLFVHTIFLFFPFVIVIVNVRIKFFEDLIFIDFKIFRIDFDWG